MIQAHCYHSEITFEEKIADKTLIVMDWHPHSPGLNFKEAFWGHLDRGRQSAERSLVQYARRLIQKTS